MKDLTLVIMAAGMGSRFGGLKQIEAIGPNKEFIIDYSIYDAIRCGFTKVVFIIKEENYDIFKETIGKRVEDKIATSYVFQKLDFLPEGVVLPRERVKPLGTGQAILSIANVVDTPFVVINADDFYGYDAYKCAKEFFDTNNDQNTYANIAYKVENTLTENGSVKRGICKESDGYLTFLVESKVERINKEIMATPLDGRDSFKVDKDDFVSMNMFCFYPTIFKYLEDGYKEFFIKNKDNLDTCEYLLPSLVEEKIKDKTIKVKVVKTNSCWYGVTYKEDKDFVVKSINKLIEQGEYPNSLW